MKTKLIKETVYWVTINSKYSGKVIGVIADSMEEAISIAKINLASDEYIKEVKFCTSDIYRKSTKTITVEV